MSTAQNVWKYCKWTVIGLTGLVLALVVFLLVWIDPNDYRDDITTLVKDKTGLVLKIDGNIGWSFYPAIGFSVENVSLAASDSTPTIVSVGKTMVSVELLPLFSRQVNVRTLFVDKLVADLVVDANGKGNWEALAGSSEPEATPESESAGEALLINVPKVVITNSIIDYEDQKTLAHQTVTIKEFVAEDIGLAREFPLHLVATLADRSGLSADIDTRAFVTLDTAAQRYAVRGLELKGTLAGILKEPIRLELATDAVADLGVQKIAVTALNLTAGNLALGPAPLTARVSGPIALDLTADSAVIGPLQVGISSLEGGLQVNVKDLTKELSYSGNLALNPFNAKNLMRDFGVAAPATTDPLAMTKVAVKTAFEGTLARAMLNNLDITLDDTHIRGNAGITNVATTALAFDLNVDAINADRYLPPPAKPTAAPAATSTPAAATAAAKKAEPLLPVDTLRTLNIDGKLAVGKITLMEWPMTNLAVAVKAKNGDIHLDPFTAGVLEGTVRGKVQVDARGSEPRIVTNLKLDKIEVGGLVKRFTGKDLFAGKTSLNLDLDTTGNDIDTLLKKAVGALDLSFADATLKGMNLNNMLTETLTQQLGAFAMLVPDYQSKLPQELQKDTLFNTLTTAAKIKDGIAQIPSFNAGVKDGAVKGGGQFNLVSMDFDYTLAMSTNKLNDNKYFATAEFPVHCKGNIAGSPASWCRPDTKAIGAMLKKAAESAVKDRVKTELANKLGLDAGALPSTQEVKEEVKQEVKKQAKEKVNKELENALKKYF